MGFVEHQIILILRHKNICTLCLFEVLVFSENSQKYLHNLSILAPNQPSSRGFGDKSLRAATENPWRWSSLAHIDRWYICTKAHVGNICKKHSSTSAHVAFFLALIRAMTCHRCRSTKKPRLCLLVILYDCSCCNRLLLWFKLRHSRSY